MDNRRWSKLKGKKGGGVAKLKRNSTFHLASRQPKLKGKFMNTDFFLYTPPKKNKIKKITEIPISWGRAFLDMLLYQNLNC
jgi:hypothetical protein